MFLSLSLGKSLWKNDSQFLRTIFSLRNWKFWIRYPEKKFFPKNCPEIFFLQVFLEKSPRKISISCFSRKLYQNFFFLSFLGKLPKKNSSPVSLENLLRKFYSLAFLQKIIQKNLFATFQHDFVIKQLRIFKKAKIKPIFWRALIAALSFVRVAKLINSFKRADSKCLKWPTCPNNH